MARYLSILTLTAAPEARDEAIAVFLASEIIEKCRDVIPGFLKGTLLKSLHDDAVATVLVEWRDQQAYEDWMTSPSRGSGGKDRLFAPPTRSHLYELVHEVQR